MDERSVALNDKPIQARSKHHIGDMYVHKKHKFVVRTIGRGAWSQTRRVEVVAGEVPLTIQQRVLYRSPNTDIEGNESNAIMEYSTCALSQCFTKLKAGQVLFG